MQSDQLSIIRARRAGGAAVIILDAIAIAKENVEGGVGKDKGGTIQHCKERVMGSMGGATRDGVEEATKNGVLLGSFEAFAIIAGIGGHVSRTCSRKGDAEEIMARTHALMRKARRQLMTTEGRTRGAYLSEDARDKTRRLHRERRV